MQPADRTRAAEFRRAILALQDDWHPFADTVFRAVSPEYASSKDLLSGRGSRLHGGRWNPHGAVSAVLAAEKTLVMLPPSAVIITIETIEISTMISAYSTRPWPLPVFAANRFR